MALEPQSQTEVEGGLGGGEIRRILPLPVSVPSLIRALRLVAVFAFVSSMGCAQTPAQRAEADMKSVERETDVATLVERGRGFASVGDHTRAEEYLAAAIDAGANPREVLPLLMEVCVRAGRYRSAIQHGENHLRKHSTDLRTRVIVGALYVAISDGKQARKHLERIVSEPEDAVDRGDAQNGDGGAPAAAPPNTYAFSPHVARPEPLYAQAHYLLGVIARDTDTDVVKADHHFREYLRIEPNGSHAEEAKSSLLTRVH